MESFWSMTYRDVEPFLMGRGTDEIPKSQNILKESNMENSSEGSNESDDDDFAMELEDELMGD